PIASAGPEIGASPLGSALRFRAPVARDRERFAGWAERRARLRKCIATELRGWSEELTKERDHGCLCHPDRRAGRGQRSTARAETLTRQRRAVHAVPRRT